MPHPNQAPASESVALSPEELAAKALEQNAALKRSLLVERLVANGYQPHGTHTRRGINDVLQQAGQPGFNPEYRPTLAEIYNKRLGEQNWTAVPTGVSLNRPSPQDSEPTDITAWKNEAQDLYIRQPEVVNQNPGLQNASEIQAGIEVEFPSLVTPQE